MEGSQLRLSVDHVQSFGPDMDTAIGPLRYEVGKHIDIRPNGRFVAFNVGEVKVEAEESDLTVDIIYTPKNARFSHSSICLPDGASALDAVALATMLIELATPAKTYHAVLPASS